MTNPGKGPMLQESQHLSKYLVQHVHSRDCCRTLQLCACAHTCCCSTLAYMQAGVLAFQGMRDENDSSALVMAGSFTSSIQKTQVILCEEARASASRPTDPQKPGASFPARTPAIAQPWPRCRPQRLPYNACRTMDG